MLKTLQLLLPAVAAAALFILCGSAAAAAASPPPGLQAGHLRCENAEDPRGIDAAQPRLSWQSVSDTRGQRQTAYQVLAAGSEAALKANRGDLWDSGKVASDQSLAVKYAGAPLPSGGQCWWKVRVWDKDGKPSAFSPAGFWQMGLPRPEDWKAQWISAGTPRDTQEDGLTLPPSPYLRRTFTLTKPVKQATLYVTARGLYEMHLNGERVGDAVLAPGWTDYTKRIQYQTYEVASRLRRGDNALGAILGDGWYSGYVGFSHKRDYYGDRPQLLAQLQIEFADGSRQMVVSDDSWQGAAGPILSSDLLMGEHYDARLEPTGWDRAEFSAAGWTPVSTSHVTEGAAGPAALVGTVAPPVRVTQLLTPRRITQPTPGTYLFDLGQNMVGWARLKVQGAAGTSLRLRFGEMLNPDGTLYVENLRAARATDTYTCKGGGQTEVWEPHFTFHGFRYVEVTGSPTALGKDAITGCVVGSDLPAAGTFACSSPMVNQLQSNIVWSQRSNFLSIPTDCPQRDERLGWMGDAQIFARTATYNRDMTAFYEKWMQDVADSQSPAGGFPDVAPRLVDSKDGAPAWADAGIIVPWTVYQAYGDKEILERHWPAMTRWMDYVTTVNPDGLWTQRRNNDFGDWLSIAADTPKDVLATAYYGYDASLMARMAWALGRVSEAAQYDLLFAHIKDAFNAAYVSPDGRIKGDTQTDYVVALRFGLLPESLRPLAAQHLMDGIIAKNNHLSTGFVGVGYLCPTLTEAGHDDMAYQLLLKDTFPSWGYSISQGATTIWERWDGWTKEKGFQDPKMNSFNHYSLGSVGQWLYQSVAGIDTDPDHPGYKHILLHPYPNPRLSFARATLQSPYGAIASAWKTEGRRFTWDVTVPANTTATVWIPALSAADVTESGHAIGAVSGIRPVRTEPGFCVYEIGSGTYHFAAPLPVY